MHFFTFLTLLSLFFLTPRPLLSNQKPFYQTNTIFSNREGSLGRTPCSEIYLAGNRAFQASQFSGGAGQFVAHGLGMVTHEPPIIHPDNLSTLEAGMVLSIETDFEHCEVGRVKIEDTVVVTSNGTEGLGDTGRNWTIVEG